MTEENSCEFLKLSIEGYKKINKVILKLFRQVIAIEFSHETRLIDRNWLVKKAWKSLMLSKTVRHIVPGLNMRLKSC